MLFYYDSGFNLVSRNERRARASAADNAPRRAGLTARIIEDRIGLEWNDSHYGNRKWNFRFVSVNDSRLFARIGDAENGNSLSPRETLAQLAHRDDTFASELCTSFGETFSVYDFRF